MNALKTLLLAALLISAAYAESDDAKAQKVLQDAAGRLGWPTSISVDESDDIGTGKSYTISEKGGGSDDDLHGSILVFGTDQEPTFWLSFLDEQFDMDRSSYQGRDAVISRYGKNCNPTGIIKVINDFIVSFFEDIFGESDDPDKNCVTEHGAIVWVCGKYLFTSNDARSEEGGAEDGIAAAIYAAAQEEGLCEYGDTLIIMADTPDLAGSIKVSEPVKLAQKVNEYYGVVSYRQQPPFKFSFKDADGSRGTADWYHLSTPMATFASDANKFDSYEKEAVQKVFNGTDVPQDLYFERIMIIYPGESQQKDPSAAFYDACDWKKDSDYIEVDASQGKRKIYSKNFIFMSEKRDLGTWAHEFGHSLPSSHTLPNPQNFARISDRYNYVGKPYGQYGEVLHWGLMGYGAWWGSNANSPVHMSGFTKNAAGWLGYAQAAMNHSYTLKALEDMKKGDSILVLDDPASANPDRYYIIEARNPKAVFGAPESGIEIYKVSMRDGHHVVNALKSQANPARGTNAWGTSFQRVTLYDTSGNGSTYRSVPGKFKITMTSKSDNSSAVFIEEYDPARLIGASVRPTGPATGASPADRPSVNVPPPDDTSPKPDIDLHAYDSSGNHVGMNYQTGDYEAAIPGAVSSGDLSDDEEWIFVPEGTQVRFEISTYDTQAFLSKNPAYVPYVKPQEYSATAIKYDSGGQRSEAGLGAGNATSGQIVPLKSPADPSLDFVQKDIPGVGNNSICPLGMVLMLTMMSCVSLAVFRRCN